MAKQTGPSRAVKGSGIRAHYQSFALVTGCICLLALAGCASAWQNPRKSAEEARTDERACSERAEENALTRAGRQRADYRTGYPTPQPGMSRGETPMEMLNRRTTQDDYTKDFEDCMSSKGYTQR